VSDLKLSIADCRQFKYCVHGVRRFCARHAINFNQLLKGTLPISEFERTGDAMALKVVEYVRNERRR
jgi:hypothetical protein